jgi:predicted aspartyl protease
MPKAISIPTDIYSKLEKKIIDTGFDSVADFVIHVLRELVAEDERTEPFSKKDEEKVKARLKSLGYFE